MRSASRRLASRTSNCARRSVFARSKEFMYSNVAVERRRERCGDVADDEVADSAAGAIVSLLADDVKDRSETSDPRDVFFVRCRTDPVGVRDPGCCCCLYACWALVLLTSS